MLNLKYSQHITVLGKTGGGKTILLQYLATLYHRVIVFDIEQRDGWEYLPGAEVVTDLNQLYTLVNRQSFLIIFQPPISDVVSANVQNLYANLCEVAYNLGTTALLCDEIAFTQKSKMSITPWANGLIMLGRKRWCSVIVASRRNQEIHNAYITQSDHYFIFKLKPYDLNAYVEFIPHIHMVAKLPKYHCLYIGEDEGYKILQPCPIVVGHNKPATPFQVQSQIANNPEPNPPNQTPDTGEGYYF